MMGILSTTPRAENQTFLSAVKLSGPNVTDELTTGSFFSPLTPHYTYRGAFQRVILVSTIAAVPSASLNDHSLSSLVTAVLDLLLAHRIHHFGDLSDTHQKAWQHAHASLNDYTPSILLCSPDTHNTNRCNVGEHRRRIRRRQRPRPNLPTTTKFFRVELESAPPHPQQARQERRKLARTRER